MSSTDSAIDPRLAKAAAHPLRMRILTILNQRVASPVELARELDEPLANVSYHVKMLETLDCVELVSTTPRRGALEHHYRALERPILTADDLEKIPLTVRRGLAKGILTQISKDLRSAAERGGFDRPDVALNRMPMSLDDEGFTKLSERFEELIEDAMQIQADSAERVHRARDGGDEDAQTFSANMVWMLFEQPPAKRKKKS
jgi:DNA-binding transcriptional ArsR family regulator